MYPKVSIIIPTFNRAAYLPQAIESALAQDYPFLEIIVSDNASTDGTVHVIEQYRKDPRFRYFRNAANLGMVRNWRKAVFEYSSGDYFLLLSDDDYFIDGSYITKAVDLIKREPGIVFVFANGYVLHEPAQKQVPLNLPYKKVEDGTTVFLNKGQVRPLDFILGSVLFNKQLAGELNAFSNEHNICCDSELFLKMCLFGKVGIIHDYVSVYRIHGTNLLHLAGLDLNILVNNLDFLLEPYRLAKQKNVFSAVELKRFEKRLLLPAIRGLLMTTITWHEQEYENVVEALARKNPESLDKARGHLLFRSKLFIARYMKWLYYCISGSYRRRTRLGGTKRKS